MCFASGAVLVAGRKPFFTFRLAWARSYVYEYYVVRAQAVLRKVGFF